MDILQQIIELIRDLGWIGVALAGVYFFWKLAMMGSILVVVKYAITKLYDITKVWIDTRKNRPIRHTHTIGNAKLISNQDIEQDIVALITLLSDNETDYIHRSDVQEAIKKLR